MATIKSEPKLRVIAFLKFYQKGAHQGEHFKFTIAGNTADAKRYVQRMRVELTRMRQYAELHGRVPVPFKMMVRGFVEKQGKDGMVTEIALEKTTNGAQEFAEINEVFDELATGKPINV